MRLYLMRHGKAGVANVDELRALSDVGGMDVQNVADYLAATGLSICHVFHSTLVRARQTAEIMAATLTVEHAPLEMRGVEPWGDVNAFVKLANGWSEDTLVCGHEPFMGNAAMALRKDNEGYIAVHTATVMAFERLHKDQSWDLKWMVNPKLIKQGRS